MTQADKFPFIDTGDAKQKYREQLDIQKPQIELDLTQEFGRQISLVPLESALEIDATLKGACKSLNDWHIIRLEITLLFNWLDILRRKKSQIDLLFEDSEKIPGFFEAHQMILEELGLSVQALWFSFIVSYGSLFNAADGRWRFSPEDETDELYQKLVSSLSPQDQDVHNQILILRNNHVAHKSRSKLFEVDLFLAKDIQERTFLDVHSFFHQMSGTNLSDIEKYDSLLKKVQEFSEITITEYKDKVLRVLRRHRKKTQRNNS